MSLVVIGRLGRPHGLDGEMHLDRCSLSALELHDVKHFTWRDARGRTRPLELMTARPAVARMLVTFAGVGTREAAAELTNGELLADSELIPDPGPGMAYNFQLVGLAVQTGEGRSLGTLVDIFPTGAHAVYVVQGERELLIPATPEVVRHVDLAARTITVELRPGSKICHESARSGPMKISILTIFPDFFGAPLAEGMIRLAQEKQQLVVNSVQLREFTEDSHRTTDDYPFGGGAGMIMKVEPIDRALQSLAAGEPGIRPPGTRVVLFSPQGRRFTQSLAIEYASLAHLVLVCGRYKGVDERVAEHLIDEELSLGDFVLSGGEPAALCVVDAVARLLPEVVGTFDSVEGDSFHSGLLDSAYYTRPAEYRGWTVPEVLMSGNHAAIARHRREEALRRTLERRPELLESADLSPQDRRFLEQLRRGKA